MLGLIFQALAIPAPAMAQSVQVDCAEGSLYSDQNGTTWKRVNGQWVHWSGTWKQFPADASCAPQSASVPAAPASSTAATTASKEYVSETYSDGTIVSASTSINKTWKYKNTGSSAWSGYSVVMTENPGQFGGGGVWAAPVVQPGQVAELTVSLTTPSENGVKIAYFELRDNGGKPVGNKFWVKLLVVGGTNPIPQIPRSYPSGSQPALQFAGNCQTSVTTSSWTLCVNGVPVVVTPQPGGWGTIPGGAEYAPLTVCSGLGVCKITTQNRLARPAAGLPAASEIIDTQNGWTKYSYSLAIAATAGMMVENVTIYSGATGYLVTAPTKLGYLTVLRYVSVFSFSAQGVMYLEWAFVPNTPYESVPAVAAPAASVAAALATLPLESRKIDLGGGYSLLVTSEPGGCWTLEISPDPLGKKYRFCRDYPGSDGLNELTYAVGLLAADLATKPGLGSLYQGVVAVWEGLKKIVIR